MGVWSPLLGTIFGAPRPACDLEDRGDELVLRVDMPGVRKEDIEVEVTETSVKVRAEAPRAEGRYVFRERPTSYFRVVELPEEVKPSEAKASYRDGVLEVALPKARPRGKAVRLKIE